ncbi:MAG: TRAP transporter substrate-binding protein DctP [Burkholderiaceae bacterium]
MKKRFSTALVSVIALASALAAPSSHAMDQITATHAFPGFLVYTKTFLALVEDINKRGEGKLKITVKGGPEAIGMFEQPNAARDGVVDMVHVPGSFYGKSVPEIDAMVAAANSTVDVRVNGGAALMEQAHQKRFNVKHLGWIDGGVNFHIYMTKEPKFDSKGVLDLTGVKLRDNPIYHAFFESLNATTASMKSTEVYAALEKGVVDASAWTSIGLMDLKWDKFMKYRVDPAFYQTDLGVIFNLDKWKSLSEDSRKIIQQAVIDWEKKSFNDRQSDIKSEAEKLQAGGMKFVPMNEAASKQYLQLSIDAAWARMKSRMTKDGDADTIKKLQSAYMGG